MRFQKVFVYFRNLFLVLLVVSCSRSPLRDKQSAMRPVSAPSISDDLGRAEFIDSLEKHVAFLSTLKGDTSLRFGPKVIALTDYVRTLSNLIKQSRVTPNDTEFFGLVEDQFDFYEVYGGKRWGEVLLTSYFEPEIPGSLKKTPQFSEALLRRPTDLVEVSTSKYDDRFLDILNVRGRMWRDPDKKRDVLVPYYTRGEIHSGSLDNRKLELCWVDPIDAFFMQIQGSGTVVLPGEHRLRLGYSDQNGHLYHSIGKFLTDIIPLEKMSMAAIEGHLKSIPLEQARLVMDRNPSFVFFEKIDGAPKTMLGNAVFAGRTIATDSRYFPKGAVGFLRFKKPVFATAADAEPTGWEETSRFVFDHDTGGAIRGGGRVDLFWGSGAEAKRHSGFVKDAAHLVYLVPTEETIKKSPEDQFLPPAQ